MHGNVKMRVAQFLTTLHTAPHVIYLTRHGQSEYNVLGKIGGNPPLSEAGNLSALPAVGENLTISLPSPPTFCAQRTSLHFTSCYPTPSLEIWNHPAQP